MNFQNIRAHRLGLPVTLALGLAGALTACSSLAPGSVLPGFGDDGAPVKTVLGAKIRVANVDLSDPSTVMDIGLAGGADRPNQPGHTVGAEDFSLMVQRAHPALAVNGTFFSEDGPKRVMGDMIRAGRLVKFSPWEDGGTSFVLHAGNRPEMITARAQGAPDRSTNWLSMTGGPRLLRDGKVYLHPREEGFRDPDVFHSATRTALGFSREGKKLLLVSFLSPVSLELEARVMKSLGTYQAMNLDGGTSQALAVGEKTLVAPGRHLTNILAVYDRHHPAPRAIASAWGTFGQHHHSAIMMAVSAERPGDRWIGKLKPGQILSYAGLNFSPKGGDPTVGILGGKLAFSEGSFGQIYAAFPKPRNRYKLDFEARLLEERMAVALGPNLSLEVRRAAPSGLFLRRDGVAIGRDASYVPDRGWHRYQVVDNGANLRVAIDGHPTAALNCAAPGPGSGLGLSGRGEYRRITLADAAN
jgi:hypothetical protein